MRLTMFKTALRKRVEMKISELEVRCDLLRKDLERTGIKRTTSPVEYAKRWIKIKDLDEKIKMLKELL